MDTPQNQRLFRLTSRSNDGVFDTTFNEDIDIEPGSAIALQSIAFDRQSEFITIDGTNDTIQFGLNEETFSIQDWKTKIPQGDLYKLTDSEAMMNTITDQLNRVISVEDLDSNKNVASGGYDYSPNLGSQWLFALNQDGGATVSAKTSTPVLVSDYNYAQSDAFTATTKLSGTDAPVITAMDAGARDSIARPTGGTGGATDYNESYAWGKVRMCKGAASLRMRLAGITATGDNVCATMGFVTDKTVLEKGSIADGNIHWGLQCTGNDSAYRMKQGSAASWVNVTKSNTDLKPANYGAPVDVASGLLNDNDVMEIQINGDRGNDDASGPSIDLLIHQASGQHDATAATNPPLGQATDYYWFISFHQDDSKCAFDMVEAYVDPYQYTQDDGGASVQIQQSGNATCIRQALYGGVTPILKQSVWELADRKMSLQWQTDAIAAYWGYQSLNQTVTPTSLAASEYYKAASEDRPDFTVKVQNYLLLFDTVPLDSFDTYARFDEIQRNANTGGQRQNILASIPTIENQLDSSNISQVSYEPPSPNYITLRNRSNILTRSLTCRLVTATYQPVTINGMSSLTVLIAN